MPASPAPLASIHDQVAEDWVNDQAMQRARGRGDADRGKGLGQRFAGRRGEGRGRRIPPSSRLGSAAADQSAQGISPGAEDAVRPARGKRTDGRQIRKAEVFS